MPLEIFSDEKIFFLQPRNFFKFNEFNQRSKIDVETLGDDDVGGPMSLGNNTEVN